MRHRLPRVIKRTINSFEWHKEVVPTRSVDRRQARFQSGELPLGVGQNLADCGDDVFGTNEVVPRQPFGQQKRVIVRGN